MLFAGDLVERIKHGAVIEKYIVGIRGDPKIRKLLEMHFSSDEPVVDGKDPDLFQRRDGVIRLVVHADIVTGGDEVLFAILGPKDLSGKSDI